MQLDSKSNVLSTSLRFLKNHSQKKYRSSSIGLALSERIVIIHKDIYTMTQSGQGSTTPMFYLEWNSSAPFLFDTEDNDDKRFTVNNA
jgi:hypothetical protein